MRHSRSITRRPGRKPEDIEDVEPAQVRKRLGFRKGALDVLVGGPPCQGFSINAPERFLSDKRNKLFKDYLRFLEEFEPKAFLFENVPGLLSLGDGKVFRQILREFEEHGYHVTRKDPVCRPLWRAARKMATDTDRLPTSAIAPPEPTHYATGRANFRSGGTMTFQLEASEKDRLLPAVTVGEAIGDLPRLEIGEGAEIVGYTAARAQRLRAIDAESGGSDVQSFRREARQTEYRAHEICKARRLLAGHPAQTATQRHAAGAKIRSHKRYGRLRNDGLAGTVMTKCDPHWGTVFLPDQERSLTVREAARFQSFPDTYKFLGPRVSQYEQVETPFRS